MALADGLELWVIRMVPMKFKFTWKQLSARGWDAGVTDATGDPDWEPIREAFKQGINTVHGKTVELTDKQAQIIAKDWIDFGEVYRMDGAGPEVVLDGITLINKGNQLLRQLSNQGDR